MLLWLLGYPDQALARMHEALAWHTSCRIPLAWREAWHWAPSPSVRREGPAVPSTGGRRRRPSRQSRGSRSGWHGSDFPWVGAGDAGQERRGWPRSTRGLTAYRATGAAMFVAFLFLPAGGSVWTIWASRRRPPAILAEALAADGAHRGPLVGSGGLSAHGALLLRQPPGGGGGSLVPAGPRRGPSPAGQVAGSCVPP